MVTGLNRLNPCTTMGTPVVGLELLVMAGLPNSGSGSLGVKLKLALTVLVLVCPSDTRNWAAVAMRMASLRATLTPAASLVTDESIANKLRPTSP